MSSQPSSSVGKPADYVYFERTIAGFSEDALPRSKAAQLKLEHYYKVAVEAAIERNQRYVGLCDLGGPPFIPPCLRFVSRVLFVTWVTDVLRCVLAGVWRSSESSRLIR